MRWNWSELDSRSMADDYLMPLGVAPGRFPLGPPDRIGPAVTIIARNTLKFTFNVALGGFPMFKKTLVSVSVAALAATAAVAPMAVSAADAPDFLVRLAKCNPCGAKKVYNPCAAKNKYGLALKPHRSLRVNAGAPAPAISYVPLGATSPPPARSNTDRAIHSLRDSPN